MGIASRLTEWWSGDRRPVVIVVLGARSGTSALAGTLGILGCTLPRHLMAANFANSKGYFEPQDLADLHDGVLMSAGSSWDDWREFPASWFSSPEACRAQSAIVSTYRSNYGVTPLAVLKEPRMCRILPLWHRVFKDLGVRPAFCFVDRHPLEVARSLQGRDGSSLEQGLRYYVRNHLDAERDTRGYHRAMISYDDLLSNWRTSIAEATRRLGATLRPTVEQARDVDSFLEYNLRHSRPSLDKYPNNELQRIALDVHEAYRAFTKSGSDRPLRQTLDLMRARFETISRPQASELT